MVHGGERTLWRCKVGSEGNTASDNKEPAGRDSLQCSCRAPVFEMPLHGLLKRKQRAALGSYGRPMPRSKEPT